MAVGDAAAGQVVRGELDLDLVTGEDADVVLSHLAGDRRQNVVTPVEFHPKHGARESFGDLAFDLDLLFLAGHPSFYGRSNSGHASGGQSLAARTVHTPVHG